MECVGVVEQVGGLVMELFVSQEKNFNLDLLWVRKPVEDQEERADVRTGVGAGEQQSGLMNSNANYC